MVTSEHICSPFRSVVMALDTDSESSLALSGAASAEQEQTSDEELRSSSSEGSYASAERVPSEPYDVPEGCGDEVDEPEVVREVYDYPIVSQRHTWCTEAEHEHYQHSYQHQVIHGFNVKFQRTYQCFGRRRGRRITTLEVRPLVRSGVFVDK